MDNVLAVQMCQTFARLEADGRYLVLCDNRIVVDHICQGPTFHKLHDDPELVVLLLQE